MRLGEGTGAAMAWPLIDAAARLMTRDGQLRIRRSRRPQFMSSEAHTARPSRFVAELRLLLMAVQYFTRLPMPSWVGHSAEQLNGTARYFSAVGVLVGAIGALAFGRPV